MTKRTGTALIVNPSPDVYGADLQMLQSVVALVAAGWDVAVALPADGVLVPRLQASGATVYFIDFPVLRKGNSSVRASLRMVTEAVASIPRAVSLIRYLRPQVLLINTVTLPWWLVVGKLTRTPTVVHLHEAETQAGRLVRQALLAPLFLADAVIVISHSALDAMVDVQPRLKTRSSLIYNGVPQPPEEPLPARRERPFRIAVVGRLSPRKAPDVALEATALLRSRGFDVQLEVAGTAFPGYEWYETQLRARAAEADLAGSVVFSGYCAPIWPVLSRADVILAPSLHEPFGNAVVEAQMSARPVVAAASQGHLESITDGESGLLVEPGDAEAMAAATQRLFEDPELSAQLATTGRAEAIRRFSVDRYRREVAVTVADVVR